MFQTKLKLPCDAFLNTCTASCRPDTALPSVCEACAISACQTKRLLQRLSLQNEKVQFYLATLEVQ